MIEDHGGFAHDDTNVIMLVAHPQLQGDDGLGHHDDDTGRADDRQGVGSGSDGRWMRFEKRARRYCPR